jgi:hypothetical protein
MAKVNFTGNIEDAECYLGACAGLYSRAIADNTGMTAGRAQYRIQMSGGSEKRRAWREGKSPWVRRFMDIVRPEVRQYLEQVVVKKLAQQAKARQRRVKRSRR